MKIGDMVVASYNAGDGRGKNYMGTVIEVEEVTDLFSEKYAITETNTYVRVLVEGQVMTFAAEDDNIEVIKSGTV